MAMMAGPTPTAEMKDMNFSQNDSLKQSKPQENASAAQPPVPSPVSQPIPPFNGQQQRVPQKYSQQQQQQQRNPQEYPQQQQQQQRNPQQYQEQKSWPHPPAPTVSNTTNTIPRTKTAPKTMTTIMATIVRNEDESQSISFETAQKQQQRSSTQVPPGIAAQVLTLAQQREIDADAYIQRAIELHGNSQDDETDNSYWAVAGDGQAWAALGFFIVLLLPWTLFCYAWTLAFVILSSVLMIIPPLGYLFTVLSVTSWRALARADLALSAAMVSNTVQMRFPYIPAKVFIAPESGPACYRGAKHMKATLDHHTISSMLYFLVWKMMFGIPIFIVMVTLFVLTVPFMVCFLPSLLMVSRTFANWQYRWAVKWLSEKPAPIVL
ncbi:hypothetical protein BGX26_005561 [Mortierella sp. AD094]|nr:hypothetical protein BGX26_005561 [Mortierella sp. AD094]